jgi:hypothetical protein
LRTPNRPRRFAKNTIKKKFINANVAADLTPPYLPFLMRWFALPRKDSFPVSSKNPFSGVLIENLRNL